MSNTIQIIVSAAYLGTMVVAGNLGDGQLPESPIQQEEGLKVLRDLSVSGAINPWEYGVWKNTIEALPADVQWEFTKDGEGKDAELWVYPANSIGEEQVEEDGDSVTVVYGTRAWILKQANQFSGQEKPFRGVIDSFNKLPNYVFLKATFTTDEVGNESVEVAPVISPRANPKESVKFADGFEMAVGNVLFYNTPVSPVDDEDLDDEDQEGLKTVTVPVVITETKVVQAPRRPIVRMEMVVVSRDDNNGNRIVWSFIYDPNGPPDEIGIPDGPFSAAERLFPSSSILGPGWARALTPHPRDTRGTPTQNQNSYQSVTFCGIAR